MRDKLLRLYLWATHHDIAKRIINLLVALKIDSVVRKAVYFIESTCPNNRMRSARKLYKENYWKIEQVKRLLADDLSRNVYDAALLFRATSRRKDLMRLRSPASDQYFDPNLFKLENETLVDCGAYVGDTIKSFFIATKGLGMHVIYAFEPNPANYSELENYLKRANSNSVQAFRIGTGKEKASVRFRLLDRVDAASKISATGDVEILIDSLDVLLSGKEITLIKMDVEGAETDTILGAREIITRQKPKLAICIYHSDSDMFTIPLLIHELAPEYKLYIRHYSDTWLETVLYAIYPDDLGSSCHLVSKT